MSRANSNMASIARILLVDVFESMWANANVARVMVLFFLFFYFYLIVSYIGAYM